LSLFCGDLPQILASPYSLRIAVFVIGILPLCYSLLCAYAAGGDFPVDESHQNRFKGKFLFV
jgi:hypothetical protein